MGLAKMHERRTSQSRIDPERYPLCAALNAHLAEQHLTIRHLQCLYQDPTFLYHSPKLAKVILSATGRLLVDQINRTINKGNPGPYTIPMSIEVTYPEPEHLDYYWALELVLKVYEDHDSRRQGYFIVLGGISQTIFLTTTDKPGGATIELEEIEQNLKRLVERAMAAIPMELIAKFVSPDGRIRK